jgi:hypothetical protein
MVGSKLSKSVFMLFFNQIFKTSSLTLLDKCFSAFRTPDFNSSFTFWDANGYATLGAWENKTMRLLFFYAVFLSA